MATSGAGLHPTIAAARPQELLVMLYDRLVLDVQRGLKAQRRRDTVQAVDQLTHALSIVEELQRNVDVDELRGGYELAALYEFLNRRLVMASIGHDTSVTDECLALVTDLCQTWRQVSQATTRPSVELLGATG
jgi:flagellar secretion chaperone FliS